MASTLMHIPALIGGALINFWGDVSAALFALLPLPLGFILGGFFVACWGFVGL